MCKNKILRTKLKYIFLRELILSIHKGKSTDATVNSQHDLVLANNIEAG